MVVIYHSLEMFGVNILHRLMPSSRVGRRYNFAKLTPRTRPHLFHNNLDISQRDSLVVAPDDELEKIVSQHLEDHADVSSVDAADFEVVQKLDTSLSVGIHLVALTDLDK